MGHVWAVFGGPQEQVFQCFDFLWKVHQVYVLIYKCNFLNMLINCLLCIAYYVAYSATGKLEVQFELAGPNSCYGWALVG